VTAPGERSVGAGSSSGIIQTGDGVSLGAPAAVEPPPGGLAGLPRPPARAFVGRAAQLAELARPGARVVHGLGGVGKSELALQYAHRHRDRYRVVWWVLADTAEAAEAGLAELAAALHPDVRLAAGQADAATWALAWLQSHDRWLLILDNVERRGDVEHLLGRLGAGHVVLTTRRDVGWDDITDGVVRLDALDPADAVALLTRLTGTPDRETAALLAAELGGLPLALQQAGAYLRQTRSPLPAYLARLRTDPARVLASVAPGDDAQRAVARTWTVTTEAVAAQNPLALHLLRLLSCYAPDDLPRDVLTPAAPDPAAADEALGLLASYSMITLNETTITTHRLVQTVTRLDLPADLLAEAARLLDAARPAGTARTTPSPPAWRA
jgi:hypothetical protein